MRRFLLPILFLCLLAIPVSAAAHPERATEYPDHTTGSRPSDSYGGRAHYVCKQDSRERINKIFAGKGKQLPRTRRLRLRQLELCKFEHIQAAIDAAKSGERIRILPGVYNEEPSRAVPLNDPVCPRSDPKYWEDTNDGHGEDGKVPTYRFHFDCKNSRNLVQISGDSPDDPDLVCDQRCNLKIEGLGRYAKDTLIVSDRLKRDVIRADRADGIVIRNLATEQGAFNGIDVVETNGFLLRKLHSRFNQNYGVLTFTSDNGLYDNIEANGNGDSGVYPGSGPEGHCQRYGIEIRDVRSYGNVLGLSGTAGNGTWTHDSKFFNNAAGIINDSFVPGHPGMPQDCSKWTKNEIHSNNRNPFELPNQDYCRKTPFKDRPRTRLCPQFQVPVGSGVAGFGINANLIEDNKIYDNWRQGVAIFWVPAVIRGENDPDKQTDTSNENRVLDNLFGTDLNGESAPNGVDLYWDEEGTGNCWGQNRAFKDRKVTSNPATLPTCEAGGSKPGAGIPGVKTAFEAPCATWDPQDNPDPPGCSWFKTPPRPPKQ